MTDIFREIDEELRRDRYAQLWKKHGNIVIALAVLVIAGTAGWRYWRYHELQKAEAAGARFEQALTLARDGKQAEAESALAAVGKDAPSGYRQLARFRLAGETGLRDAAAGAAAYDALAADAGVDPVLRDLATLRAALLRLDSGDPKQVLMKLEPLAAPGKPWRHTAREMLGLAAMRSGDYEAAGRWFDQLVSDPEAPAALRQRSEVYLALVRGGPVTVTQ